MTIKQLNLFDSDYFEDPTLDDYGLEDLKFRVHTSLIYKLGEELIKNEVTAISELVKNSYDADSSYVELLVDPFFVSETDGIMTVGEIIIKDEGCGMDKKDIVNGWLTLSNSVKKKMKKERKVTKRYERMPLGDKGLGRLAVQKLGRVMILVTKKENSNLEYTVTIPWGDFQKNTTLENVKVSCSEKKIEGNIEKGYTNIIIRDLLNPNLWKKEDNINELERELSQIVSPFRKDSSFYIFAKVGERNLDFAKVSQEILDGAISKFRFDVTNDYIQLKGEFKLDFLLSKNSNFEINEDHIKEFLTIYKDKMEKFEFRDNNLFAIKFEDKLLLEELSGLNLSSNGTFIHPGRYDGEIYSYSLDKNYLNGQIKNLNFKVIKEQADFRRYIHQNYGLKVFRDDFAIIPYGYGEGGDWLALSKSQSTSGSFYDLKNDTIIGFIQLYGKDSYNLREKTNREGLIEDEYYENFYNINKILIKKINNSISKLKKNFNTYVSMVESYSNKIDPIANGYEVAVNNLKNVSNKSLHISSKIDNLQSRNNQSNELLNQVNQTIVNNEKITPNDRELLHQLITKLKNNLSLTDSVLIEARFYLEELSTIKNQLSLIEQDYGVIVNRMQELAELAGLGILTETLTHELYTLINNTKKNTTNTINYFKGKYEADNKLQQYFNYVRHSTEAMRKQISHLSPNFRNVRTKKETVKIASLLIDHQEYYKERAQKNGITINVINQNDFVVKVSIGMINQVLDNLYLNAEHWLLHGKAIGKVQTPHYYLEIREGGKIQIWDNGLGINENIANEIFDPFVSNKENGRGLGLYIVSQILEFHNCKIRLMRDRNDFGRMFKFEIDLRNSLEFEEK
jgi:signal transduction histidine kinase